MPPVHYTELPLDSLSIPKRLFDRSPGLAGAPPAQLPVPPVVHPIDAGAYEILDGCKRHLRMKRRRVRRCMCAVTTRPLDIRTAGLLRIMLNRGRARPLEETLCFVRWLNEHIDPREYHSVVAELGFGDTELRQAHRLADCPPLVVRAVARGALHPAVVEDFQRLRPVDRRAFLRSFAGLRLSRQTQRELIQWLADIVATRGSSVAAVLGDNPLQGIFRDATITNPQRIDKIRKELFERRFPRLAAARRTWRIAAARHNPDPKRVSFVPDPSFERDRLEVRITLRNPDEACGLFGALEALPRDAWRDLLRPWDEDSGAACR